MGHLAGGSDRDVRVSIALSKRIIIAQATLDQIVNEGSDTNMAGLYHVVLVRLSHIQ
jgi:hypothetical protein